MKHVVAALAAVWQSRHARRIKAGLPTSLPEVSDDKDDTMMETASDDTNPAPAPPVHIPIASFVLLVMLTSLVMGVGGGTSHGCRCGAASFVLLALTLFIFAH